MKAFSCPDCGVVLDVQIVPIIVPNPACPWVEYFRCPVCKEEKSLPMLKELTETNF